MYFGYINQWQHLTDDDMMRMDVSNPNHPNHTDFIKYIKKLKSGEIGYIYNLLESLIYYTNLKLIL